MKSTKAEIRKVLNDIGCEIPIDYEFTRFGNPTNGEFYIDGFQTSIGTYIKTAKNNICSSGAIIVKKRDKDSFMRIMGAC